jgi:predicted nucleotidyltransferase
LKYIPKEGSVPEQELVHIPDFFMDRHNNICKISAMQPLEVQLNQFISDTTMNDSDLENRKHVIRDLQRVLTDRFKYSRVHPFGSYITVLGDRDSDLDIFVDAFGGKQTLFPYFSKKCFETCLGGIRRAFVKIYEQPVLTNIGTDISRFMSLSDLFIFR